MGIQIDEAREGCKPDLLRMDYINSLPQPLMVVFPLASEWPLYDICVQTGSLRIDVCGLLEVRHIGEVIGLRDASGVSHNVDDLYNE